MSGNNDGNSWSAEYFTITIYSISVLFVAVNDKRPLIAKVR